MNCDKEKKRKEEVHDYFILYDYWLDLHGFSDFICPERLVSPDSDGQEDHYDHCLGCSGPLYSDPDLIAAKKEVTRDNRLPK